MPDQHSHDCLTAIIGGGAAGLAAALSAADVFLDATAFPGSDRTADGGPCAVMLLEKQERAGRKLLATGNGQCNISNLLASGDSSHYHGRDSHFSVPALRQFDVEATRGFFRRLGLMLQIEPDGRIYPYSRQASAVLDVLRLGAASRGIRTVTSFEAVRIEPSGLPGDTAFTIHSKDGQMIRPRRVILACGGLAAPSLGGGAGGHELAARLGHPVTRCFPSLVPVTTETDFVRGLAGMKFDGIASVGPEDCRPATASGEILLTEYGLSGPPILELSRNVAAAFAKNKNAQVTISLDMVPGMPAESILDWLSYRVTVDPDLELADFLTGFVNKKIGQAVLKRCLGRPLSQPVSSLSWAELIKTAESLKAWPVKAIGTRGWQQAQVTAGGLDTGSFDPETMESKLVPGFYAAGEVLDIDGDCGGYNLQWAWSSGFLAGRHAMASCLERPD